MKKIAVLGITGSIGTSTIQVVRNHADQFQIVFASSHNSYDQLFDLASEFKIPELVITNEDIKSQINDIPDSINLSFGEENLIKKLEQIDCDIILNAISGSAGLRSSFTAISRGIDLALANKESLVMAGHLLIPLMKKTGARIIPVDSEHSAIFQAIGSTPQKEINSLILTASGGPFRKLPLHEFDQISVAESLNHPTWEMGAKITIDSATMMNKALEIIEAHWLFDMNFDKIKTVIHPQSIIHSFVEFVDGSILAQMSFPSMQLPILYALSYPNRIDSDLMKTNILDLPNLTFEEVDENRYPLFALARKVGQQNGILPTILNAANEAAIQLYLDHKISFTEISKIVYRVIEKSQNRSNPSLQEIIDTNQQVFEETLANYQELK
ncbi:MAG: 1-deoxy-D-xylulose-5-phosphate reductoisomerase [Candidatus Cloacimonetes bacterium]|nr:1-deoxy-D-xylulose-5-phosphate reductoisomerase [Candidatus Cloacimonadota bacterium]MCF7814295.1 1-deoxy-D-xylulose-5-phosphate reductoisomerase [Candidatus Cloacimonadota bacterium]MCF7868876.1 1-deoxy-D-xylulose-5-phosphate reductoisomerase [Candidatus Cloacimonadota bacterium]MCF7884336.1 1-deoxy-D-xylulose-5-phosphate reductoisomerase [Candidatus Cloacimonadota bacterium]